LNGYRYIEGNINMYSQTVLEHVCAVNRHLQWRRTCLSMKLQETCTYFKEKYPGQDVQP